VWVVDLFLREKPHPWGRSLVAVDGWSGVRYLVWLVAAVLFPFSGERLIACSVWSALVGRWLCKCIGYAGHSECGLR
jgi:hypothetical protein